MIKAVIFDYYGVVCPNIVPILAKETAKQFGVKHEEMLNELDRLLDTMDDNSITFYQYWRRLKLKFKNKEVELSDHRKIWKNCSLSLEIWSEMKNLIQGLKSDYNVPVLSNVTRIMAKYNRMKGRYKIFTHVFLSCDIGLKKPSTAFFRYALKKLKLRPTECIFVDDKERSFGGAEAIGIKTILFKNVSQVKRELRRFGVNGI